MHLRALQTLTSLLIHVLYICHGGERLAYKARYGITVEEWNERREDFLEGWITP